MIVKSFLFSLTRCIDIGLETDETEEDFGVWQVKTMVAIIFSMLSETCSKWDICMGCSCVEAKYLNKLSRAFSLLLK